MYQVVLKGYNQDSGIVLYTSEDGSVQMDVRIDGETVWLTQQQMAQLFGKTPSTINEHIKNIFAEEELNAEACVKKFGKSEFQQKALEEYHKFQLRTLSPVEQAYIAQLEQEAKSIKKK